MHPIETYKTIEAPSTEIVYKEKNSKFIGYIFPVINENEIKFHLDCLKKNHPNAVHFCYAYQIGVENIQYRVNDDGEPSNSAGKPIYGQIKSFGLTNVLVVIVRYFGGIKLGVSGLITAYKTAAVMTINESKIIEKTIKSFFIITFDYKDLNKIMRIIKEKKLQLISQKMDELCQIEISSSKKNEEIIFATFNSIPNISIEKLKMNNF